MGFKEKWERFKEVTKVAATLVFFTILLLFVLSNLNMVDVRFLFWRITVPQASVIFTSMLMGTLVFKLGEMLQRLLRKRGKSQERG